MKSETLTISLEKSTQDSIPFYSPSQPFGFVDEAAHNAQPSLNIFELNSGFNVPYWYASEPITQIQQDENGCFLDSDALVQTLWEKDGAVQPPQRFVPLCFKAAVPHAGNYRVKLTLTARAEEEQLLIFHGCRCLAWKGSVRQGAVLSICFSVNASPIIPNGKTAAFEKNTLDIAVVGHCPALDFVSITPIEVPTIYLAGDSTMADYGAEYPYHPAACYGGWGQALDLYLDGSVTVCNHAHNGRSTETFRNEGHFDLIQKQLRPGDFVVSSSDTTTRSIRIYRHTTATRKICAGSLRKFAQKKPCPFLQRRSRAMYGQSKTENLLITISCTTTHRRVSHWAKS